MRLKCLPLIFPVIASLLIASCKKEGCDDPTALNYSSEANTNNGTCIYEGSVVFWYNDSTSIHLNDSSITELTFYIDSQPVGYQLSTTYAYGQPECGQGISHRKSMKETSASYYYYVHDQNGMDVWSGTLTLVGGYCNPLKLEY